MMVRLILLNKSICFKLLFLLIIILEFNTVGIGAVTNSVPVTCRILSPYIPLDNDLITILDYDSRIIYTPGTKVIVRLNTSPGIDSEMRIQNLSKVWENMSEKSNGIYYGEYKVRKNDVKRGTKVIVHIKSDILNVEKTITNDKILDIDKTVYKDEGRDRIIISDKDAKTRVYILKDSLFEDVNITITKKDDFDKTIAYEFNMVSAKTKNPVKYFKKYIPMDIHFNTFQEDIIERIGLRLSESERLMIYYYDGVQWMPVGGTLNKDKHTLTANINHFSIYAIKEKDGIQFKIGPNPFTPNNDGINDAVKFFIINEKEEPVRIFIYKLNGSLVRELEVTYNVNTGVTETEWNGRDYDNDLGEDGIYIYKILVGNKHYNGIVVLAK